MLPPDQKTGHVCPDCGQPLSGLTARETALLNHLQNQIKLTSMLNEVHADVTKHVLEHIALLTRQRDEAWQARDAANERAQMLLNTKNEWADRAIAAENWVAAMEAGAK